MVHSDDGGACKLLSSPLYVRFLASTGFLGTQSSIFVTGGARKHLPWNRSSDLLGTHFLHPNATTCKLLLACPGAGDLTSSGSLGAEFSSAYAGSARETLVAHPRENILRSSASSTNNTAIL